MLIDELRLKSESDLRSMLEAFRTELLQLKFMLCQGKLTNTARLRLLRRSVARVLTVLYQKQKSKDGD